MDRTFVNDVKDLLAESLTEATKNCGFDGLSPAEMDDLVAALAEKVVAELKITPPINPDREYSLSEIGENRFGPKKGRFYKAYKAIIRKDGRRSYVLGRDLLDLRNRAPTLATSPAPAAAPRRRPRGRPRKAVVVDDQAPATADVSARQQRATG